MFTSTFESLAPLRLRAFALVLCIWVVTVARADTTWVAAGNIHGTWTANNSPYVVFAGHVIVPADSTLSLEAGTTVLFTGPYEFVINGKLLGEGTADDSIRFSCDTIATPSGWRGLRFVAANDSSYLHYGVIEHGRATGVNNERYGGGVEIDSCDVALRHCAIRHNRSVLEGGGLYIHDYAIPTIEYCVIEHNHSNTRGGGIAGRVRVRPALHHCVIRDNSAVLDGGGMFMDYRANPDLLSCEIHGNQAGNRGGGLYSATQRWIQQTNIRNCIWYDNASSIGGAICGENAEIVVDFSTFALNTSLSGTSAIQADGCSLVVSNAIFAHLVNGAIGHTNAQLAVATSCFFDVGSTPIGGVIPEGFGDAAQLNLFMDSVDVYNNTFATPAFIDTALRDFRLSQSTRVASIGTFPASDELLMDMQGTSRPSPAAAPPDLGALEATYQLPHAFLCGEIAGVVPTGTYIIPCDLTIPTGNTVLIEAGTVFQFTGDFKIDVNGTFAAMGEVDAPISFVAHPSYNGRWSGLHFQTPIAGSQLVNCVFEDGLSDSTEGGFLTVQDGDLSVDSCVFRDIDGIGGVLFVTGDSVIVRYSSFEQCELMACLVERGGTLYLDECIVQSAAGGVMLRNDSHADIRGSHFLELQEPAFLVTDVSELTIRESAIRHCRGNSAGLAVHGGIVNVMGTTFAFDTSGAGSVVQLAGGETTFLNCDFDSCGTMLFEGGGVVSVMSSGTAIFDSCRFTYNTTAEMGGAAIRVAGEDAYVTISRSVFAHNNAIGANASGGALYSDWGHLNVSHSLFNGNESEVGGAARLVGDDSDIENCIFYQNTAARGSGLFLDNYSATITGSVFAGLSESPVIAFWGDCASASVDHVCFADDTDPFQFESNLPDHGPLDIGLIDSVNFNQDSVDSYGNLFVNPFLVNPEAGDFHVLPTSACVNAGSLFAPLDPDSTIGDVGIHFIPIAYSPSSPFELLTPVNGSIVFEQSVVLSWHASRNSDESSVRNYVLEVANNPEYDRPSVMLATADTTVTIAPVGGMSYWRVTAYSSEGCIRRCTTGFAFTRPETLTPFDLIEPITGYPHPVNWPLDFRWQHSIDPSGQNTVTYSMRMIRGTAQLNIPLDTANHFTTIPADWNIQSGDQIRWSVFAHIDSPDTSIESLSRNWLFLTDSAESAVDVNVAISDFALHPVFPNPFNSQATLIFDIPRPSQVTLHIFDLTGREVEVLLHSLVPAGRHSMVWNAERFASGTYFVRLASENLEFVQKTVLLR